MYLREYAEKVLWKQILSWSWSDGMLRAIRRFVFERASVFVSSRYKEENYIGWKGLDGKTLEAFNDVFADIINGLLFNGKQVLHQESLIDAQTFSMYKNDGKLHHQDRDVAKY